MKRLFTIILTALILSICAFAAIDVEVDLAELYSDSEPEIVQSGTCGTNVTWTLDSEGTLVISGEGAMNDYYFSSSPWKSFIVKNAIISDGVTSIGTNAFYNCTSLEAIEIPDSVTSIGSYVFCNCTSLESVEIGNSVTSIGAYAFSGCSNLFFIYITDLKAWCEIDCNGTPLRDGAKLFLNGKALNGDIVIPEGTTKVSDYAFYCCKNITSIKIPDSVTSIGYEAFYNCASLESVKIGNGVTSIGSYAFYDCTSLKEIEIPDSVTSIGDFAFYYCTSLKAIEIPDSVRSIGYGAFSLCNRLTDVYITDIGAWCGINFESSTANPFYNADNMYLNGIKITEVHIPETVSSIGKYTFYNCYWIKKLYIPKSVTKILPYAFESCNYITEIYYEGTEDDWDMIAIGSNNDILSSATLYTEYVPESYKVYFDANTTESVENMPEVKFALGTFTFPETSPKRIGYRFLGWSDEKGGEVKFVSGQKTEIYEEKTFYAVWEKKVTIFDNPIKLEAAPFFSADGKTATVIINLSGSVGFGGLSFDVGYDVNVLELVSVTPAFAGQYCSVDAGDGVINFNITDEENITGNGALALISFNVAENLDSVFTEIEITPDKDNCFGYDEDDDYNPAPLNVETINGKIKPKGDFTGDGLVDMNDAILLLQHSMFPELYPIE